MVLGMPTTETFRPRFKHSCYVYSTRQAKQQRVGLLASCLSQSLSHPLLLTKLLTYLPNGIRSTMCPIPANNIQLTNASFFQEIYNLINIKASTGGAQDRAAFMMDLIDYLGSEKNGLTMFVVESPEATPA